MNTPLISIIIAVFKTERVLPLCLDALLAQTLTDWECLLIDDASPDGSGSICDSYAARDSRFRVVHKAHNEGASAARQTGLELAQGDFVIHCDSDDWTEPTMLSELYEAAVTQQSDLVICDYFDDFLDGEQFIRQDTIVQRPTLLTPMEVLRDIFEQRLIGSCCNKLVRRQCILSAQASFPAGINFCEDLYFLAQLLCTDISVSYLPRALYHYTHEVHHQSLVFAYNPAIAAGDLRLRQLLTDLTQGTAVERECRQRLDYLVVSRAFNGEVYSSRDFARKLYDCRRYAYAQAPRRYALLYYLSCCGLYRLARRTDLTIIRLHHLLLSILNKKS